MLIKFLDKQYEVIQNIKATDSVKLYVAKDLNAPGQELYTIACISDSKLIKKLIFVTTRAHTSIAFKDLHDCFNAEGKYCIVFRYAKGKTLRQALSENDYNLKERLLLMKNIFEQLFLLDMPDCFIYEVLNMDNIVADQAMGIRFNYYFTEINEYWEIDEKRCLGRAYELVLELFGKEIREKSSVELTAFVRKLEQGEYRYLWDCYEDFDGICERVTLQSERHELQPNRIWWRAWEGLKKKFPVIRSTIAIALILAAGIYLLLHLPNPVLSDDGIVFQQIGTLELQEDN